MVTRKKPKSAAHFPVNKINPFDPACAIGIDDDVMAALACTANTGATTYNGIDLTPYVINPNTATVVVRFFLSPDEIRSYVCTIFFDKGNQKAWHAFAMDDLNGQLTASEIDQLMHSRLTVAEVLMRSIKEHISIDPTSIKSKMLIFTRFVTSLLGMGIYVFDTPNSSTIPAIYSSSQLDEFIMLADSDKLEFLGLPPEFRKGRTSKV